MLHSSTITWIKPNQMKMQSLTSPSYPVHRWRTVPCGARPSRSSSWGWPAPTRCTRSGSPAHNSTRSRPLPTCRGCHRREDRLHLEPTSSSNSSGDRNPSLCLPTGKAKNSCCRVIIAVTLQSWTWLQSRRYLIPSNVLTLESPKNINEIILLS